MECDNCQYFQYDETEDEYYCTINLDEDEMADFLCSTSKKCRYFKLYDEYKMVEKQN